MNWLCDITYSHCLYAAFTHRLLYAAHRSIICPYTSTVYQAVAHWHPCILSLYSCNLIIPYSLTISYDQFPILH